MLSRIIKLSNQYYGGDSISNRIVSKYIFHVLEKRRSSLEKVFKSHPTKTNLPENSNDSIASMLDFLNSGLNKLNIGGGHKNLKNFINIDFVHFDHVEFSVVADIRDLFFVPDNSITHIHSNHVIEHLTQSEFEDQLRQYKRILKQNGRISIRCPNTLGVCFGFFIDDKIEADREAFLSLGYPEDETFSNSNDYWFHKNLYGLFHWLWAQPGNIQNQHLNLITPSKVQSAIESSGFKILLSAPPESPNIIILAEAL